MLRSLSIALLVVPSLCAQESVDPWKPLRFLLGAWDARVTAGPAQGSGSYLFQTELGGHVLVRHSATGSCKGPLNFNCEHSDLLYIYTEEAGAGYQAIYFDNEGHVIHYRVTTAGPASATFLSDEKQPGPQFRLIYELKNSVMSGKFQIRAPGAREFRSYLEWEGAKK
jgi:hypothetical protein